MPRKMNRVEESPEEIAALESVVLEPEAVDDNALVGSASDIVREQKTQEEFAHPRFGPPMWSEQWQEFVLSQFLDSERDENGNPFVHGLRRVARKLLGPILESGPVGSPRVEFVGEPGQTDRYTMLKPVTATYQVRILWTRPEDIPENGAAFVVSFSDCADVTNDNTDPEFRIYPSAMACTRAEARCLRKALQLRKAAAEEISRVPMGEASPSGLIRESDIIFIDALCRRLDINVMGYVNMGAKSYSSIEAVPFGVAQKMAEHLTNLQNKPEKIPAKVRGYDSHWREQAF